MSTYVLYDNDADGFTSAYAAFLVHRDAVFIPMDRGQRPPEMRDATAIYILDFNFDKQTMLELAQRCPNITLLDHHASAQQELSDLTFCKFDLSKSTAVIAWEYFHPAEDVPVFFGYVQDADLYKWQLPFSREVHFAVESHVMDFPTWESISQVHSVRDMAQEAEAIEKLVDEGTAIERYADTRIASCVGDARLATFIISQGFSATPIITFDPDAAQAENCYQVPVANCTDCAPDVGHKLLDKFPNARFAATYRDIGTGLRQWFLCSRGDFDVSEVCRQFGGGGHKAAGGFRTFHDADYGAGVRMAKRAALSDDVFLRMAESVRVGALLSK